MDNTSTLDCCSGEVAKTKLHDRDYAVYEDEDFESGVAAFKARVSSPHKGFIEIRLDFPTGKLLGTYALIATAHARDVFFETRLTHGRGHPSWVPSLRGTGFFPSLLHFFPRSPFRGNTTRAKTGYYFVVFHPGSIRNGHALGSA